jgi:hypothetical protein
VYVEIVTGVGEDVNAYMPSHGADSMRTSTPTSKGGGRHAQSRDLTPFGAGRQPQRLIAQRRRRSSRPPHHNRQRPGLRDNATRRPTEARSPMPSAHAPVADVARRRGAAWRPASLTRGSSRADGSYGRRGQAPQPVRHEPVATATVGSSRRRSSCSVITNVPSHRSRGEGTARESSTPKAPAGSRLGITCSWRRRDLCGRRVVADRSAEQCQAMPP